MDVDIALHPGDRLGLSKEDATCEMEVDGILPAQENMCPQGPSVESSSSESSDNRALLAVESNPHPADYGLSLSPIVNQRFDNGQG